MMEEIGILGGGVRYQVGDDELGHEGKHLETHSSGPHYPDHARRQCGDEFEFLDRRKGVGGDGDCVK